jgi:hypothetical protein
VHRVWVVQDADYLLKLIVLYIQTDTVNLLVEYSLHVLLWRRRSTHVLAIRDLGIRCLSEEEVGDGLGAVLLGVQLCRATCTTEHGYTGSAQALQS